MIRFCSPALLLALAVPVSAAPVPDRVPGLIQTLKKGKPGERVIAAETLGDLGPVAAAAVPALVEVILFTRDEGAGHFLLNATWDALERLGPKAVPALVELLAHKNPDVSARATAALDGIGPGAVGSIPALTKLIRESDNQQQRLNAIKVLAAIGPKAEGAIPTLVRVVCDSGAPGTAPRPGTNPPMASGSNRPPPLAGDAVRALAAIKKDTPAIKKDILPAIAKALDAADDDGTVFDQLSHSRDWPVWVAFGEDAAPLVPAIVNYLRRYDGDSGWVAMSLLKLGPTGQKALGEWLADKDEAVRKRRLAALSEGHFRRWMFLGALDFGPITPQLLPFLRDKDYKTRKRAMRLFKGSSAGVPPEAAKAALPLFDETDYLKSPDTSVRKPTPHGEVLISFCGAEATPALLKLLTSDDEELRTMAVAGLTELGRSAGPEVLAVVRDIASGKVKNPSFPPLAAAVLAVRVSHAPADVDRMLSLLTDKGSTARDRALAPSALSEWGRYARPHVARLFPLMKDDSAEVRDAAALALDAIDPADEFVSAELAEWVIARPGQPTQLPGRGRFGPGFRAAVPAIVERLRIPGDAVAAVDLIPRIGPTGKDALPALIYMVGRRRRIGVDEPRMRDVLAAVAALGPAAKDAVPALRQLLSEPEVCSPVPVLFCLADIGPGAKGAVPDLKELLLAPDPDIRLLAACALARIENDVSDYRATFLCAAKKGPVDKKEKRVLESKLMPDVFARVAPACPELIAPMAEWLSVVAVYRPEECDTILRTIAKSGPAAKDAVPGLMALMTDPRGWYPATVELCDVLGAIGPAARVVLPKLREALSDPNPEIALAAKEAIEKIEARK